MKKIVFYSILMFFFNGLAAAHDQVSTLGGEVSGVVYLEYRVNIVSTVTVLPGAILKIKPGSALVFLNPQARLIVYGNIQALGDKDEPIYFEAPAAGEWWPGIQLKNGQERSVFKYCRFRRAKLALDVENAAVFVWQCRFLENEAPLAVKGAAKVVVKECSFSNNSMNLAGAKNLIFERNFWPLEKFDAGEEQAYNMENVNSFRPALEDPTDWRDKEP